MAKSCWYKSLLVGAALAITGTFAYAETDFTRDFAAKLYEGRTTEAIVLAEKQLAIQSDDELATFALGSAQFLNAVEKLGQGLYRYGLRSEFSASSGGGLSNCHSCVYQYRKTRNPIKLPMLGCAAYSTGSSMT